MQSRRDFLLEFTTDGVKIYKDLGDIQERKNLPNTAFNPDLSKVKGYSLSNWILKDGVVCLKKDPREFIKKEQSEKIDLKGHISEIEEKLQAVEASISDLDLSKELIFNKTASLESIIFEVSTRTSDAASIIEEKLPTMQISKDVKDIAALVKKALDGVTHLETENRIIWGHNRKQEAYIESLLLNLGKLESKLNFISGLLLGLFCTVAYILSRIL